MTSKLGWIRDCDFDEAIGDERYAPPKIYATREALLKANPDMADPECVVYPQLVRITEEEEN